MRSLRASQQAILVASCVGMVFTQLTMSPTTTQVLRHLHGGAWHVGVLNALPTGMLFLQLAAGVVANHLNHRRWLWLVTSLAQRLCMLPVALGPWLWPDQPDGIWVLTLLATSAISQGMLHFCTPLWLSWMGDYLPREGLSEFWGRRHRGMQWTAAATLAVAAVIQLESGFSLRTAFAGLTMLGVVCGLVEVWMLWRVPEPAVTRMAQPRLLAVLAAPWKQHDFRTYIRYACVWNFAAMLGAPFISLFLLDAVGLDLFAVLLLWSCAWVGGAMFSASMGRLVERCGPRPMLILCTALKASNMASLLLAPHSPQGAWLWLAPAFMFDAVLNAGLVIANNAFLLKNSPAENRAMFIAAGTAWAGLVGGLTSIAAGAALWLIGDWSVVVAGWTIGRYEALFLASMFGRLASIRWALLMADDGSLNVRTAMRHTAEELWPWRRAPAPEIAPLPEAAPARQRRAA